MDFAKAWLGRRPPLRDGPDTVDDRTGAACETCLCARVCRGLVRVFVRVCAEARGRRSAPRRERGPLRLPTHVARGKPLSSLTKQMMLRLVLPVQ